MTWVLLLACRHPEVETVDDGDLDDAECAPVEEVPYDGRDQDCDGADLVDLDGDGADYLSDCEPGRNCPRWSRPPKMQAASSPATSSAR